MITRYILTSTAFTGAVQFNYNAAGLLVYYNMEADCTEKVLIYLLKKIPREETDLKALNDIEVLTVKKVDDDLSFEHFWNEFEKKIHPHRCEPLWKKLSETKKILALKAIPFYKAYLSRSGVNQVSPENYIKKEYWRTDWKRETN